MRKALVILTVFVLTLSMSFNVLAASDKGKGGGKATKQNKAETTVQTEKSNLQKTFKMELNEQKKAIAQQQTSLEEQKLQLETQYQEYLAAGDTAEAETVLASINELDTQLATLQSQMKQIVNERYMVTKTPYTEEELQQFADAAALIEQMYADAYTLEATSLIIKNNLIKLEAPPYIKGGRILIPVRAIEQGLGAEVTWDEEAKSVTISKDGTVVVITINSTTVTVTKPVEPPVDELPVDEPPVGPPAPPADEPPAPPADEQPPAIEPPAVDPPATETVNIGVPAEINCGRTYVPLRFLAETFGLEVDWDDEKETVNIDDGTTDNGATNDGTVDDDTTNGDAII